LSHNAEKRKMLIANPRVKGANPYVKEPPAYPEDPSQPRDYLWSAVQSRFCPRP